MIHCQPAEDKTCRLCGYADQSNLNIFKAKDIHKKVLTLYPLILYQSDPLPKNICIKCYGSALNKYEDYQRIVKIQNKWINNVRKNQPSNPYIRMLDLMEKANKTIRDQLRHMSKDYFCESFQLIRFPSNVTQIPTPVPPSTSPPNYNSDFNTAVSTASQPKIVRVSNPTRTIDFHIETINTQEISVMPQIESPASAIQPKTHQNIEHLQSILASNGCTLLSLNAERSSTNTTSRNMAFKFPRNKCRWCLKIFPNEKMLSVHQANKHLQVATHKMFEKKLLKKGERRAIEIKLNNKIWLRCQNCLNIYGNRESILNHWKNRRCEYFCKICGNEYPTDPKMLREHLLEKHGLTYSVFKNLKRNVSRLKPLKDPDSILSTESLPDEDEVKHEIEIEKEEISEEIPFEPNQKRIPVLKLTRKSNTQGDEFNIKLEKEEPAIFNVDSKAAMPILRVKDLSELQEQFIPPSTFSNLKLNTLSFEIPSNDTQNNAD